MKGLDLVMVRDGQWLKARDPYSFETLMGLTPNVDVMCRVSQPRNLVQHKLVWVLCKLIADNHPEYDRADTVMRHLKLLTGMVREFPGVNPKTGEAMTFFEAESLSFATMGQERFGQVFPSLINAAIRHMLPGITSEQIHSEIMELIEKCPIQR